MKGNIIMDLIFQLIVVIMILSILLIIYLKYRSKIRFSKNNANKVSYLSGQDFERFLSSLFYRMGYKNKVTKGSYDFGADLSVSDGRTKIVIQAKRYNSKVGIKAVQEVFSAMHYYDAQQAYVFTNSYYTKSARLLAQKLDVKLYDRNQMEVLRRKYLSH